MKRVLLGMLIGLLVFAAIRWRSMRRLWPAPAAPELGYLFRYDSFGFWLCAALGGTLAWALGKD